MTMQMKKLAAWPSRSGRNLQRYNQELRLVVGCIPYRIKQSNNASRIEDLEGGWELDEEIELAASRETLEEAGVIGSIGNKLGEWIFKSKRQEKFHEASMFSLLVTEELDVWPEKDLRQRVWMTVDEAREMCAHAWMKEALDAFVCQFKPRQRVEEEGVASCRLEVCRSEESRRGC